MTARLPLARLAEWLGIDLGIVGGQRPGDPPSGLTLLAEHMDVSESTAHRWRREGIPAVTDHAGHLDADTIACRLGVNPVAIWPEWADLPIHDDPQPSMFDPFEDGPESDSDGVWHESLPKTVGGPCTASNGAIVAPYDHPTIHKPQIHTGHGQ